MNDRLKQIHIQNAKAIEALHTRLKKIYENKQNITTKDMDYINEQFIMIRGSCDSLIQNTNPEIDDNIKYYYGKYRRKKGELE